MTTVTSLTADRMLAIEAASVVDGDVVGGNLILTKHDGTQINAGPVTGAQGPPGPVGQDLVVASALPVLDVGLVNQIRAGRQLTAADFTNMGLSAPLGLWNLSDLSDVSGNGRNLLNKGLTSFTSGINGLANTAAYFYGNNSQALYIPDSGANDPFRIKSGSFGCWFKTGKRGASQGLMAKVGPTWADANVSWYLTIGGAVGATLGVYINVSTTPAIQNISDIADDRWHFCVVTLDITSGRMYVDGILEGTGVVPMPQSIAVPFNIGSRSADGSTAAGDASFCRIDEAFITADVLSEDQIRNLYCAKLPHTLAAVPSRLSLNVRRLRKGATLAVADFSTPPLRLHNFSGGSHGDEGSNGVALTDNGADLSSGADGSAGNAFHFNGGRIVSSTDAGLPSGLNPRTCGCWFKTTTVNYLTMVAWGSNPSYIGTNNDGTIKGVAGGAAPILGPVITDGQWHHVVMVEDNTIDSGVKTKLFLDGRLVAISTAMGSLTLGGANKFHIGSYTDGSYPMFGQIDAVFVCDYALTADQIHKLYAKGSQALTPSPKNVGDHVEAMDAANILATFDTLESQHQIDLRVAS